MLCGLALAALCLLATQAAAGVSSDAAVASTAPADLELLLEVRLERHVLSNGLIGLHTGRHVLLPLGEIARLLTIGIHVDATAGLATGFVVREDRSFHLDIAAGTVDRGGTLEHFDPTLVQRRADDIYVATELLTRWWPIKLDVDFSTLMLEIRATESLPLQLRLERERLGTRLDSNDSVEHPDYPLVPTPHGLWSAPAIDLAVGTEASRYHGRTRARSDLSAYMTGDLLGLDAAVYLNGSSAGSPLYGASRARITLGRSDPDGGLLGPLNARSFAMGNVAVPAMAHVSRTSALGNGVAVSNAPLLQASGVGRHSLQGDLPPGWDVELYLNGALIGVSPSTGNGRYAFEDLPLLYGGNEFRLVFHGPQGQTRVERQTLLLDQSLVPAGEFRYRVAAHEDVYGGQRGQTQFAWGLARGLSATAGLATLPVSGVDRRYMNAGLRGQWLSAFLSGDVIYSDTGSLAELALNTRLGPVNVALARAALTEAFASEEFLPGAEAVRFRDRLRLDVAVPVTTAVTLPVSVEVEHDTLRSGDSNSKAGVQVSGAWRGLALTTSLRHLAVSGTTSTYGLLQLSSRFGALGLRGTAAYTFTGSPGVTDGSLSAEYRLDDGLMLNAGVARSMVTAQMLSSVGFTKSVGAYGLRVAAGRSSTGDLSVGVQLSVSAVREPRRGDWRFDALPMSDSGSVSARVFLDRNLNGINDAGDEPLPGVAFTVNGGRNPTRTDADGIAWLQRVPVRQHVDLSIDPGTLEDPQWSPVKEGLRLVPRPGRAHALDFAVMLTGEIDGTVQLVDGRTERGLGGIELELLDAAGRVAARATTASDGFYIVEAVPPGTYRLRVAPQQLRPLDLIDTGVRIVTVAADGEFVNGVDFDLIADWTRLEPGDRLPRTLSQAATR